MTGTRPTLASTFRRAALPLGAYYAITLGVPVANGAADVGTAFVQHASAVLVVPLALILTAHAVWRFGARLSSAWRA